MNGKAVLGAAIWLTLAAGCGGDADSMIEAGAARENTEFQANKGRIEQKIADLEKAIAKDPLDVDANGTEIDKLAAEAYNDGVYEALSGRFDALKKTSQDAFQTAAGDKTAGAVSTAHDLEAQGKVAEARRAIESLPPRLRVAKQWDVCDQELQHLDQLDRVEHVWTDVISKKADSFDKSADYERESGLFQAFLTLGDAIPAFKESPHASESQKKLKALTPLIEKARAARAAESSVAWTPAFGGKKGDLFKWQNDTDAFDVQDGEAVLKCPEDDAKKIVTYGDDDWEDYVVQAELKLVKGRLILGMHGTATDSGGRDYDKVELTSDLPADKWVKLRMEMRGGSLTVTRTDTGEAIASMSGKYPKGPFGFLVAKAGEVHFRSIWVKVFKPAPSK